MDLLDRFTIDPTVGFGKPCVRGTRIAVRDALDYLAAGMSADGVLQDFPQLGGDDVRACLAYAVERERRTIRLPHTWRASGSLLQAAVKWSDKDTPHD